ncbi:MAG: hypothetical protein WAQ24_03770 [Candidatus Saccharimonadales bacterium]
MPQRLSFWPDTPLQLVIISDACSTLEDGGNLEEVFGGPTYPDSVVERVGLRQSLGDTRLNRVIYSLAGEIVGLLERCKSPRTKYARLLSELALRSRDKML